METTMTMTQTHARAAHQAAVACALRLARRADHAEALRAPNAEQLRLDADNAAADAGITAARLARAAPDRSNTVSRARATRAWNAALRA